ncbi:3-beta hydroxysteroid dehydrogenase/isomerase [Pirellula staleyi DSM 6068]|uniref:3-beta hydroxysteroid dehydrogenase/isomerase n=1 Tax=Pirellula staleyi (strain ATCC 27377 / DSM 6068 / ICPB 4128) TaxID=530564 RepID=D2R4W1_PIRSD|nr:3-beta hydroxysteroid dehydrogenase/isomerase [Pirellula staleyi DSM 6068]
MRILVTGAAGFLGRYIVEQGRARGCALRAFARREHPWMRDLGVEVVLGDVRDRQQVMRACAGCDAVIHTAAIASIGGRWETFYDVNVRGTEHVIDGCRQHGVPKLVFTSSPSVTFAGVDQNGIDESAPYPTKWLAHYPRSKAMAEELALKANSSQLATCALRPHLIWGPRDGHLIPRLIDRARRGMLRQVGDGKNLVDSIYVENAAEAHLLAMDRLTYDSPVAGKAYFLSQGEPVNCWAWINEILALAELPPVKKRISLRAAYTAGAVLETAYWLLGRTDEPRMTRFLAAQLATSHYFDLSRARSDLGYAPKVSMAQGMRRLGEWIKSGTATQVGQVPRT